jgi:hypothetical protein
MTQKDTIGYPRTASILALVGGIVIMLGGILLAAVSSFILPHLDYTNLNTPPHLTGASMPGIVSGMVGVMGVFGLVSGAIVLVSAVMLITNPSRARTWGVLILVFSVMSFLGLGGFIVGAILGIAGGILTLSWKPPTQ